MTILHKKKIGSYPYANVLFSISSALFMIGLMALFFIYANKLTDYMQNTVEVQVVLKKDIDEQQKNIVKKVLEASSYITPRSVKFVSKEDAAQKVIEETGEDFRELLDDNPLRDLYTVQIDKNALKEYELPKIIEELKKTEGIHDIIYTKNMVYQINQNVKKISTILGIIAIAFMVTAVALINNAIKLALFSQRFLIRSMQLVGATSFFIKKPFLFRGCIQGAIGGCIASLLLFLFQWGLNSNWAEMKLLTNYMTMTGIALSLMVLGAFAGVLSVYFSVSRYLKMKLDDLY